MLRASNNGGSKRFGSAVAIDGDALVVGGPFEDGSAVGLDGSQNDDSDASGAIYLFVRAEGDWVQRVYVKASNTGRGDLFGFSATIDGDTIVVGAAGEESASIGVGADPTDDSANFSGAVYVYQ